MQDPLIRSSRTDDELSTQRAYVDALPIDLNGLTGEDRKEMAGWQVDRDLAIRKPDSHSAKLLSLMGQIQLFGDDSFCLALEAAGEEQQQLVTRLKERAYLARDNVGAQRFAVLKQALLDHFDQMETYGRQQADYETSAAVHRLGAAPVLVKLDLLERKAGPILRQLAASEFCAALDAVLDRAAAGALPTDAPLYQVISDHVDIPLSLRQDLMSPEERLDLEQQNRIVSAEHKLRAGLQDYQNTTNVMNSMTSTADRLSAEIARLSQAIADAEDGEKPLMQDRLAEARQAWIDAQKQIISLTDRLTDIHAWQEQNLPLLKKQLADLYELRPDLAQSATSELAGPLKTIAS